MVEDNLSKDYIRLRNLLERGRWHEADQETERQILRVANRKKEERLSIEDINKLPCTELRTIDQLWLKYSKRHFGFSVQKQIYHSLGGTTEYNQKIWEAFCERVGWRFGFLESRLDDSDPNFENTVPEGHLPLTGYGVLIVLFAPTTFMDSTQCRDVA